ncbi:MAG: ATPase, T2SS/T4P/T4SS family [Pseudomonadota bacterium]|jgi:type II secretory ATPase GspE/PulE/Tfp pilus assembly ATPase PilB-like protein|uniref:ATPase, T2SS/T4P/T4SS family n=3 Tax=Burkholderiaceae TaxID=119060 RepID=UPI0010F8CF86|nr:ATPase, T2SS/T4P/T4SS family [Burkholderia sp. 4M9327F10]
MVEVEQPLESYLGDMSFSDLYLEPNGQAWYKTSPSDRERHALESGALEESRALREHLQSHRTGLDFRTEWQGVALRVQRIETLDGDVYVGRRLLPRPIAWSELGYPPRLRDQLMTEAFSKGGLVLFSGGTGDGKSMSQASWLVQRLCTFGGTGWTIENPVEIVLQGKHGSGKVVGTCYQTEIRSDAEFGPEIQRLLRAAPNVIMLGEIRARDAAAQAILAGTSGHLVSSTIHANNVTTALERTKNMMRESGLDTSMMADALSAVIHQRLMSMRTPSGERRIFLTVTPLIIAGAQNETSIRVHIRKGDFSQLTSEIERQKRLIWAADGGPI